VLVNVLVDDISAGAGGPSLIISKFLIRVLFSNEILNVKCFLFCPWLTPLAYLVICGHEFHMHSVCFLGYIFVGLAVWY
jgi:hypothetical protein